MNEIVRSAETNVNHGVERSIMAIQAGALACVFGVGAWRTHYQDFTGTAARAIVEVVHMVGEPAAIIGAIAVIGGSVTANIAGGDRQQSAQQSEVLSNNN